MLLHAGQEVALTQHFSWHAGGIAGIISFAQPTSSPNSAKVYPPSGKETHFTAFPQPLTGWNFLVALP